MLEQLGLPGPQVQDYISSINSKGFVLIPAVHIRVDDEVRVYSLLSARTQDETFSYLNGVQGQFIDRTEEWHLRKEHEAALEQKLRDSEIIEEKSRQLENLANRLAKYLSPQVYESIFSDSGGQKSAYTRKNLTIFLSDIVQFTDLSDTLEPERLATVVNTYLSEMASIALECGGTIDKFIGDAVLVFFGDPESNGETEDALKCVEMALSMRTRMAELQKHWHRLGVPRGLHVRMGITAGFCAVGNFGSEQRLDYTVLGSPVNLAARLQAAAEPDQILIDQNMQKLIESHVDCTFVEEITPRGFVRPIKLYRVNDFYSEEHRKRRRRLSHVGERVEVNVIDSSDIRAAIEELRRIQEEFERRFSEGQSSQD